MRKIRRIITNKGLENHVGENVHVWVKSHGPIKGKLIQYKGEENASFAIAVGEKKYPLLRSPRHKKYQTRIGIMHHFLTRKGYRAIYYYY